MILLVSIFGGGGAIARYITDGLLRTILGRNFPWATMIINIIGSFLLGIVMGVVTNHHNDLTALIGTGFCGGFTTFSTASFEAVRLIEERRFTATILQIGGNLILSLLAVAIGLYLTA